MKTLEYYRVSKYGEIDYIKKAINGLSEKEIEKIFTKHLLNGFITTLIATHLLGKIKDNLPIKK